MEFMLNSNADKFMYKIWNPYLQKWLSFDIKHVKNRHFSRHFVTAMIILILFFDQYWRFKKCFRVIFRAFLAKTWLQTYVPGLHPEFFWLDLFYLVTWDDLDLYYGHKAQVTIQMPETLSMPIHWLCLRLTSKFCSPMSQSPKCLTFQLLPDLWRHQWSLSQFSHHVWKVYVQGYRMAV